MIWHLCQVIRDLPHNSPLPLLMFRQNLLYLTSLTVYINIPMSGYGMGKASGSTQLAWSKAAFQAIGGTGFSGHITDLIRD
ncbi:hypothetical protein D3C75_521870 [compost metagenome]